MKFRQLIILFCLGIFLIGCGNTAENVVDDSEVETAEEETVAENLDYTSLSDKELEVYCTDGDIEAALELATRYDYGTAEGGQNFSKAKQYYEMAALSGNARALRLLGYYYLEGAASEVNLDLAVDYFIQAVDAGDVDAYVGIGRAYLAGYEGEGLSLDAEGNSVDETEDGSANEMENEDSADVTDEEDQSTNETDDEEISEAESIALSYFEKASDEGSLSGKYYVACLTEQITIKDEDLTSVIDTYTELASLDKNDLPIYDEYLVDAANTRLGVFYVYGKGVEVDYDIAMEYFLAAEDYSQAQYYIGQMYENGYGVDVDYEEAFNWYAKAAETDYAPALTQLGYLYYMGYGVDADLDQAIYYEKRAAMQGYATAQINLGYLYENGIGVTKDLNVALTYYSMAAEQNYEGANEAVIRVQSLIDEE